MFKALKELYRRGKVSEAGLRQAVADGVLTAAEMDGIIGVGVLENRKE